MLRVLFADDEPIMLEGLRLMVDWPKLGFEVCGEALDGEDALQLMEAYRPHLVITDIRMPVVDGLQLIERAESIYPNTKFIILSGYADFHYARQAMGFGVSNYLTKPLDELELECSIQAVAAEIRDKEKALEQQRSSMVSIRAETVTRLLWGENRREWVDEALILLQLHEHTRLRCIQLILTDPGSFSQQKRMSLEELQQMAETAGLPSVTIHPFIMGKERCGFVLSAEQEGPSLSSAIVAAFISHIRRACGADHLFSVSSEVRGVKDLNKAYHEVLIAEIYKYPSDQKGVYDYQDTLVEDAYPDPAGMKDVLFQAVVSGNRDAVCDLAHDLVTVLSMNTATDAWAVACLLNLKLELLQILVGHGADTESWTKKWFAAPPHAEIGSLEQRFKKELLEATEWMAGEKGMRVDVSAAADYIKEHYHEKLQLQHVAEHLHVNPAYLGQRFKKQFGVAFNEYLHNVRVEEAKKLLRRAELKISNIASRVGYSDTDQFVAKFKAITGMLPSSYKKG